MSTKLLNKNNAELYDFLRKTRPEYMQPQKITQAKNLNFEEMQCKENVRLLQENNGFNDVTQFEIHEEAIGQMPKMYQTNGERRVRKSVELQIKKDIKTM